MRDKVRVGECWRLVTALFFQDDWILGGSVNILLLFAIGNLAEQVSRARRPSRLFPGWIWSRVFEEKLRSIRDERGSSLSVANGRSCLLTLRKPLPFQRWLAAHAAWLWIICMLIMYSLTRMLLIANRGQLHDDPIVFAIRDRSSWLVMITAAILLTPAS